MHAVDTGNTLWMKKVPSSSHSTTHGGVTGLQGSLFAIASAPEIYQREMDSLFVEIPVEIIVNDFLILGEEQTDIDQKLKQVLDGVEKWV